MSVCRVAAIVLAAGQSRRMAPLNKLLVPLGGRPILQHVIEALRAAPVGPIVLVTGHQAQAVAQAAAEAIAGDAAGLIIADNPDHAAGMSTSLRVGLAALAARWSAELPRAPQADRALHGVLIALGDMPYIRPAHLIALCDAFAASAGEAICVPTWQGQRGNPVLWPIRYAAEMAALDGDRGARALLGRHADRVHAVAMPDDAVLRDVDTRDALAAEASST